MRIALNLMLLSLSWTFGCAQMTQAEIKALETRELDLPYEEAYNAAANGLFTLGFTVEHSDKDSGILSGSRRDPRTGEKIASTLVFGVIGLALVGDRTEAVSFMLTRPEPTVTQLRMKVVVDGQPVADRALMTRIWQQIEKEAMLDSRPAADAAISAEAESPSAEG